MGERLSGGDKGSTHKRTPEWEPEIVRLSRESEVTALDQLDSMSALLIGLDGGIFRTDSQKRAAREQLTGLATSILLLAPRSELEAVDKILTGSARSSDSKERARGAALRREIETAAVGIVEAKIAAGRAKRVR